jgi:beta-lactamase class A
LAVASLFASNVYAFSQAYSRVTAVQSSGSQPARLDRNNTIYATAEPDIQDNSLKGLQDKLQDFVDTQSVEYGIVVVDLNSKDSIGINEHTTFVAASMYKLFVAYELMRQADLGLINLELETGHDAGDVSLSECITRSISYSDNLCGRALRKYIGANDSPITTLAEAGFLGTSLVLEYPTTTARDVGLFFSKIYAGTDFTSNLNDLLLTALEAQEVDNRLPVGLPAGVEIAHKTGDLDGYSHDGGIIYSSNADYILVVLSGPWPNGYSDAPEQIANLSKLVYDWFAASKSVTY